MHFFGFKIIHCVKVFIKLIKIDHKFARHKIVYQKKFFFLISKASWNLKKDSNETLLYDIRLRI